MEKTHWIHKIHLPNFLVGILALVLVLRIPSFFEPYYYGDEMIYLTLGQGVRHGLTLYSQIFDNKPPLLYLTAALAGNLFWFKAILAFWMLATTVVFWKLSKSKIATLIFALATTLPLLEGSTANAELFMIGPTVTAFYFLLTKKLNTKNLIFSGFLFGIATLFKIPAAFDIPAIVIFWLITLGLKSWKEIVQRTLFLSLGFLTPILLSFIWYLFAGAGIEYLKAAFLQNIGYVGSWGVRIPFSVRTASVLVFVILLILVRKKISKEFLFACLWLVFSLFAVTLSERPYPHYLIQSAAPIAILMGMFFTKKNIEQVLVIIPLTLAFFIPVFYKFYHYESGEYYLRFVNFASRRITKTTYFASFSPNVKRNYEIAKFLQISSRKNDGVFMWDNDSPTVYALSRRLPPIRFVADYHVIDYSSKAEVTNLLTLNPPKFIILTDNNPFNEIMNLVHEKYILIAQIENANIYSKLGKTTF